MNLSSNRSIVNCGLTSAHDTCILLQSTITQLKAERDFILAQNNTMRELLGLNPFDEEDMRLTISETESVKRKNPYMRIIGQ